ncbi:MAG: D-2-hydroxyacid dehydrogenase [Caulobacteraceae bacterium]|nr:D-2-hydroxyacid dehydrogenase [Caulobacteraceae bacterium]
MPRVLFYEPSFRKIQDRLPKSGIEPILMGRDGGMTLNGRPVTPDEARPEVGWTNTDLFFGGPVQEHMRILRGSADLKWLHSAAAGFEHPMFAEFVRRGVRLTTNHTQAVGIADLVLWGVLDHFQDGPERRAAQAERRWRQQPFREIRGTTWLIVGFGAIGEETARRAKAFGARIVGVRRTAGGHELADETAAPDQILSRAPQADVVVLAAPLNRHTENMANAAFFAAMKPGSVLVNVGRGGLVDEAALLAALDRGTPERAVLDVFRAEPLAPDSPFWGHPRVTLTGHTAGLGSGLAERSREVFLENLGRYLSGAPLLYEADPRDVLDV